MAKLLKILKQTLFFLFMLLISLNLIAQQERSIDNEKYMKSQKAKRYRPSREEKRVMQIEKKHNKAKAQSKKRDERLHKKAVKKHNKLINGGGKDLVNGKRTYKRMKKSKRESKNIK